ncbi:MAG: glutaredoxin domain-containing protein [Candidatus Woesebacteria bacterium]|nr:glutaredoxin domain-containing protein [Candidatus Woesebacteria bacterium]
MNIKIYSTVSCPYCKMLKDYLVSKNISFEEKLVDQDEEAKAEMAQVSGGFLGVPFVVVTKDDGTKETVIGFDKGKLEEILK